MEDNVANLVAAGCGWGVHWVPPHPHLGGAQHLPPDVDGGKGRLKGELDCHVTDGGHLAGFVGGHALVHSLEQEENVRGNRNN